MKYNRAKILEVLKDNVLAQRMFGHKLNDSLKNALDAYSESHRYYHDIHHIENLFSLIDERSLCRADVEILQIVALFHDVVYDPRPNHLSNEEISANLFLSSIENRTDEANSVYKMIMETQYGKKEGTSGRSVIFNEMDLDPLAHGDMDVLLKNEMDIFKEYQFNPYPKYREGRIAFLTEIKRHKLVKKNAKNIDMLLEYVKHYVPRIGIYAGSFNPFHIGHKNILEKASKLFDKVIVAVGNNPDKTRDLSWDEFKKKINQTIPYNEIDYFDGALSDYVKEVEKYARVTLIRGLRNGYDFSYEINQLRFIEDMYGGTISVVFIPCDREYDYISSSAIRAVDEKEVPICAWEKK